MFSLVSINLSFNFDFNYLLFSMCLLLSVFPDASGKGRQHRDEQRNLHFFAPEYGGKCDVARSFLQLDFYQILSFFILN